MSVGRFCRINQRTAALPRVAVLGAAILSALASASALGKGGGGNSAAKDAINANQQLVPKLNLLCGINFKVTYDEASLKQHNKDIGWGQTGGDNECNEPLRYIWYACKTMAGKDALRKSGITTITCKGTPGKTGNLKINSGTITVERAYEESKPYVRARRQFETHFKVKLALKDENPYYDSGWNDLKFQPNPVTDTQNFCEINGKKQEYDESSWSSFKHQKTSGKVRCLKGGKVLTDLTFTNGKMTGMETRSRDNWYSTTNYRNDLKHGESRDFDNGKVTNIYMYENDNEVWSKKFYPSGKLETYSRTFPNGYARLSMHENGTVSSIDCKPELKGDPVMARICGFGKPVTVKTVDSKGTLKAAYTFKDGVMQSEKGGDAAWGSKSNVKYKDGKKHGLEKIMAKDGSTLASTVMWKAGEKDGPEKTYHTDGKKVVKTVSWKAGAIKDVTEYYLNGSPKTKEAFVSDKKKTVTTYWDTGKVREEGGFVKCSGGYWKSWCEDGLHKGYYEDGKPAWETPYKTGQKVGTARSFHTNGKIFMNEEYADGKLRGRRSYDKNGKLLEAEEYEEDGSRKKKK